MVTAKEVVVTAAEGAAAGAEVVVAAKDAEAKTGPQIIDQATPNFRGVRPGLLLNIVTGIGLGMLFGLVGLVLVLRGGNNRRGHTADHSEGGATSGQLQSKPPPLTAP